MNLYNFYSKPAQLIGFNETTDIVPDIFFNKLSRKNPPNEKQLAAIARSPEYAYRYAKYVIKGRFPEGEKAIASNTTYAYHYAKDVINGRFPEGEKAIAKSAFYSYYYAIITIRGRFPAGEKAIAGVERLWQDYKDFLK